MPKLGAHSRKPRSRSEIISYVVDLAGLYGWRHHHASPGLTAADYSDGFPSEVLLREGRLVMVTISGLGGALTRPEEVWIKELGAARAIEVLVVPRDDLSGLARSLRPRAERDSRTRPRRAAPEGSLSSKDEEAVMPEQIKVVLNRTKDTKHTTRFDVAETDEESAAIRTLYVRQSALEEFGAPESLLVTVVPAPSHPARTGRGSDV
jgi:hypothetical protein